MVLFVLRLEFKEECGFQSPEQPYMMIEVSAGERLNDDALIVRSALIKCSCNDSLFVDPVHGVDSNGRGCDDKRLKTLSVAVQCAPSVFSQINLLPGLHKVCNLTVSEEELSFVGVGGPKDLVLLDAGKKGRIMAVSHS